MDNEPKYIKMLNEIEITISGVVNVGMTFEQLSQYVELNDALLDSLAGIMVIQNIKTVIKED